MRIQHTAPASHDRRRDWDDLYGHANTSSGELSCGGCHETSTGQPYQVPEKKLETPRAHRPSSLGYRRPEYPDGLLAT